MAKKRPAFGEYHTDFSWKTYYMELLRNPQWVRRKQYYPYIDDRASSNLDYSSDLWHRVYGGETPRPGDPNLHKGRLSTRLQDDFSSGKHRIIQSQKFYYVPEGYLATSSGYIYVGDQHPDFVGDPSGDYEYITNAEPQNRGTSDHFIVRNIGKEDTVEHQYTPVHASQRIPRLYYMNYSNPPYQAPVWPKMRFPTKAVRALSGSNRKK